jgi:hypothetical protein
LFDLIASQSFEAGHFRRPENLGVGIFAEHVFLSLRGEKTEMEHPRISQSVNKELFRVSQACDGSRLEEIRRCDLNSG